MATKSLKIRRNPLSSTDYQIDFLSKGIFEDGSFPSFEEKIKQNDLDYILYLGCFEVIAASF